MLQQLDSLTTRPVGGLFMITDEERAANPGLTDVEILSLPLGRGGPLDIIKGFFGDVGEAVQEGLDTGGEIIQGVLDDVGDFAEEHGETLLRAYMGLPPVRDDPPVRMPPPRAGAGVPKWVWWTAGGVAALGVTAAVVMGGGK